jgi:Cu+-exporting ATPase
MTLSILLMIMVFGVFFYLMMKKGGGCCGGHDHGGQDSSGSNKDTDQAHHHMETDSVSDGTETDPVCGMKVKDNRIESSHLGRTFHFCSEQCKKVFNLNPNKYAGA